MKTHFTMKTHVYFLSSRQEGSRRHMINRILFLFLMIGGLEGIVAESDPSTVTDAPCTNDVCCFDCICCGPGTLWNGEQCVFVRGEAPYESVIPFDWIDKCFVPTCVAGECCGEGTRLRPDPTREEDACWCVFEDYPEPTPTPSLSPSPTETSEPTTGDCKCSKTGKFFVNGKSTSSVKQFAKPDGTMPTPAQVNAKENYVKRYDGKTSFEAEYHIALDKDGKLKKESWVQFTAICYTSSGVAKEPTKKFITEMIPITEADIDMECKVLNSFKMATTNWYPAKDNERYKFDVQSLTGSVDLMTKTASWVAEYGTKREGLTSSFLIEGDVSDKSDNCM